MDDNTVGCSSFVYGIVSLGVLVGWAYICAKGLVPLNGVIEVIIGIVWVIFIGLVYTRNGAGLGLFSVIALGVLITWAILCGKGVVPLDGTWEIILGVAWLIYTGCGVTLGVALAND